MKAWIYNGPRSISLNEIPMPECGKKDVILKTVFSTICGTDAHAYLYGGQDVRIDTGREFGHEVCAEVAEVGSDVKDIYVGQRVYPLGMFCGPDSSKSCMLGGFSEYIHVSDAKIGYNLFPIPDEAISDEAVALIEPLSVGWRAASETQPQTGDNAVVFGAGGIGAGAAFALKMLGCDKVAVVDRNPMRLDIMRSYGFSCFNTDDEDHAEQLRAYLGVGRGLDGPTVDARIMIEATGSEEVLRNALHMLPFFGTLQIVAIYSRPQQIDTSRITFGAQRIVGGGGGRIREVNCVIDMLRTGQYDPSRLVTARFAQAQLEKAILATCGGSELKIGIDYRNNK